MKQEKIDNSLSRRKRTNTGHCMCCAFTETSLHYGDVVRAKSLRLNPHCFLRCPDSTKLIHYRTRVQMLTEIQEKGHYNMCNTFIIKQDLPALNITTDIVMYVSRNCTVSPEEQCSSADKRTYSMNKII